MKSFKIRKSLTNLVGNLEIPVFFLLGGEGGTSEIPNISYAIFGSEMPLSQFCEESQKQRYKPTTFILLNSLDWSNKSHRHRKLVIESANCVVFSCFVMYLETTILAQRTSSFTNITLNGKGRQRMKGKFILQVRGRGQVG